MNTSSRLRSTSSSSGSINDEGERHDWKRGSEKHISKRRRIRPSPNLSKSSGNVENVTRSYTPPTRLVTSEPIQVAQLIAEELTKHTAKRYPGVSVSDCDIPEFDPFKDDVLVWTKKVDEHADIYKWEDKYISHLAINKLKGSAKIWFQSLREIPRTWNDWKNILVKTFPPSRDLCTMMTHILMFRPKENQNLFEYCFEKLSLIRRLNLNLSGKDEVNLIIGGFHNENLKLAVKSAGISDPAYLAAYIKDLGNDSGCTQVLVFIDSFTKFCFIYAVRNTKTKYVIDKFNEMIKIFGVPKRIISDRSKSFTSKLFQNFCASLKVTHHLTAVGMPRGNGQVERYNRTILSSLSTMGADKDDDEWHENISNIQLGLNNTLNKVINTSPSEALLGYRTEPSNFGTTEDLIVDVTQVRRNIVERNNLQQQQQKKRFDSLRAKPIAWSIGDLVLVQISSIVTSGSSRKLVPKWKGPFRISQILDNDRYQVNEIAGSTRSRVPYTGVYATEHMKRWRIIDE